MCQSEPIPGSHELILSQFLESRVSHELNRFKTPKYCFSHELIRINALSRMPKKRLTKFSEILKMGQGDLVKSPKNGERNLVKAQKRSTKSTVDSNHKVIT